MKTETASFLVTFQCTFCGHQWQESLTFDPKRNPWVLNWCINCGITKPQPKQQVRYGAPDRRPSGAVYADRYLERGGIYTISKVKRWQHGCHIELKETGTNRYELLLFTPVGFTRPSQEEPLT